MALRRELTKGRGAVRLLDPSGESTPVFFIVGYQKSGTTWLMKIPSDKSSKGRRGAFANDAATRIVDLRGLDGFDIVRKCHA